MFWRNRVMSITRNHGAGGCRCLKKRKRKRKNVMPAGFYRGGCAGGLDNSLLQQALAVFLMVGVAGGFEPFSGGLRLFHFAFVRQLQRTVNLADQNIQTVTIVISALSAALPSSFGGVAFCASTAAPRIFVSAAFSSPASEVFCTTCRFSRGIHIFAQSAANAETDPAQGGDSQHR
jgi:hypothetical protein